MSSLLIRNGTIITASDHYRADILVKGEKVAVIAETLDEGADRVIDTEGCYLYPGGIDAHTHMELPFMGTFASDTFHSGTLAAVEEGFSNYLERPPFNPRY